MRRGFTLLEILVAMGVMVLIALLAWETLASTLQVRDLLEREDEVNRSAQVAMERVAREISLAYLTPNQQSVNTYRTVFVGRDEDDTDQLWFAAKSHRRTRANSRESDQTEVTLWVEDDPNAAGRFVLFHREAQRVDHEPDRDGAILPLARSVTRFDLRYLDPTTGEWRVTWDTTGAETPNRLPRAVTIVLTVQAPDPSGDRDEEVPLTLVRTVVLETAPPLARSATASSGNTGAGPLSQGVPLR